MIYNAEWVLMNTIIRVQVTSSKGTVFTKEKIEESFNCFDHVIEHFSRFDEKSELNQLNNGKITKVSKELFRLINTALKVARITKGIYDPTIIDLLEMYGYDKEASFKGLKNPKISDEVMKLAANRPSFEEIELDDKSREVKLAKGQRLDLGSLAKGYAVDLAYDFLMGFDFEGILINAGGDIRAFGVNQYDLPWSIALYKAPLPNQVDDGQDSWGKIELLNESVSGSGGWARRVGLFHHLLNPKNGLPLNEISQTYVIAPTAMESDLWATVLFLLGQAGLVLLQQHEYKGMVVDHSGAIYKSKEFIYH
jgi:thiamine biosynthesis lipoprotein